MIFIAHCGVCGQRDWKELAVFLLITAAVLALGGAVTRGKK